MAKKILIISTSLREKSNSEILARQAQLGAKDAGNDVEFISLRNREIGFCKGCLVCQKTGKCVIRDGVDEIIGKVRDADTLVFVSPVYYYSVSGQLKTLLDRLNPLFPSDYAFRDVYLMTAAAEDEDYVPRRAVSGLEGWIECFERARLAGTVFMGGVTEAGEMNAHPEKLEAARSMGRSL